MRLAVLALVAVLLPAAAEAGQNVTYSVGGADYEGYSAAAVGPSKGLVVIVHDWDGLTKYEQQRADMLSQLGYDAFALDLFGKGNRPATTDAKKAETGKLYKDRKKMLALMLGGLAEARKMNSGPAVVMGYCFGGAGVLELARSGQAKNVAGYATFHGALTTPPGESYPAKTPPLLIAQGGADTAVPVEALAQLTKELEAAGVTYEARIYSGAPHAFTVFGAPSYRERADRASWKAFQDFLAAYLPGR